MPKVWVHTECGQYEDTRTYEVDEAEADRLVSLGVADAVPEAVEEEPKPKAKPRAKKK